MCWIEYMKPELHVAEQDISVFKIIRQDLHSYYRFEHSYTLNKVYTTSLDTPEPITGKGEAYGVYEGFHSYHKDCPVRKTSKTVAVEALYELGTIGIYWTSPLHNFSICRVECIIPERSLYYLNTQGEYVSSSIKIIKIIENY